MGTAQNLAIFVLASQVLASGLLILATIFDMKAFNNLPESLSYHVAIPGFLKTVHLFRSTKNNLMMGVYFLSLSFIILSYAGAVLMFIQVIRFVLNAWT
ncbi:MAG: hypothetical protein Tsb0034_04980 [Ekhidna sp.]